MIFVVVSVVFIFIVIFMDGKAVATVTLQDLGVSLFMHYSPNEIEINRGIQSAIS